MLFFWHSVGNRIITLLSNMFTNLSLTDVETCYKLVRTDLLKGLPLRCNRFAFEIEITARLAQVDARIWELPVSNSGRTYGEGKKITWRDGLAAMFHILRCNLFPPRGDWRSRRPTPGEITRPSMSPSPARKTRVLGWIVVMAILVRGLFAVGAWLATRDPGAFYAPDTSTYLAPARELLAHGTFTVRGRPELVRTPGYPLLLVLGIWLGYPEVITIALQVVLSALTVVGVFVLARRLFSDERVALTAAAIYAVEPLSVVYTAVLLSETLFTVVVVWSLVLIVEYARGGQMPALVGGAALLAASAYVRPVSYFLTLGLLVVLGGYAVLCRRWRMLVHISLAAAAVIVVVAPWQLRNRALGFRGMSAVSALNMYFYNAAALRAARDRTSLGAAQAAMGWNNDSVYLALHPEQGVWRPGGRFQFMAEQGAREVKQDWTRYARMHIAGMVRVLLDPGAIDMLRPYRIYPDSGGLLDRIVTDGLQKGLVHLLRTNPLAMVMTVVFGVMLAALYGLALRGLAKAQRYRDLGTVLLVAAAAYFVVIAGGPAGLNRFRHPAMPLVCVLAAAGLSRDGPRPFLRSTGFVRPD